MDRVKKVRLETLCRQYELLYGYNEIIGEYFSKVLALTNQMKGNGEKFSYMLIIETNFKNFECEA